MAVTWQVTSPRRGEAHGRYDVEQRRDAHVDVEENVECDEAQRVEHVGLDLCTCHRKVECVRDAKGEGAVPHEGEEAPAKDGEDERLEDAHPEGEHIVEDKRALDVCWLLQSHRAAHLLLGPVDEDEHLEENERGVGRKARG